MAERSFVAATDAKARRQGRADDPRRRFDGHCSTVQFERAREVERSHARASLCGYLTRHMAGLDLTYVALGDSTGVGVGARDGRGYVARLHERLRDDGTTHRLLNLCVSGATSYGVVTSQLPRALASDPDLATVFMGINDLLRGVTPEQFGENVARVARAFQERAVRTLMCTLPDLSHAPAARLFLEPLGIRRQQLETRTVAFNARILEHAQTAGHEVRDLFDLALRDRAHFFSTDGFHPSAEGYEELANQLWPTFRRLARSAA